MDDFSKELAIAVVSSLVTVVTEQAIEAIAKALKERPLAKPGSTQRGLSKQGCRESGIPPPKILPQEAKMKP
mgnify:CR=1 FL=1